MELSYLLYWILIAGSPGFGIEALILGKANKPYSAEAGKARLLKTAIPTGLAIVGSSILISTLLNLQPIYLCATTLLLTPIAGKTLGLVKRSPQTGKELIDQKPADGEIKSLLRSRGLENLIEDDD